MPPQVPIPLNDDGAVTLNSESHGSDIAVSDDGVPSQSAIPDCPQLDAIRTKLKFKLSEFRKNNHMHDPVVAITGKPISHASALELCCGSANYSAALRTRHINAIGVDYGRNPQKPRAPTIQADLSTLAGQQIVDRAEADMDADIVHAAPPCGTASKARDRPVPLKFRLKGAPCPRPLRSAQYPRGIPSGLTPIEQLRVDSANKIYDYVLAKCIARHKAGKLFSLENPSTSYFWLLDQAILLMNLPGVKVVDFQQCAHGGDRPVWRRWTTNIPQFESLAASCPGISSSHSHAPFGVSKSEDGWKFDTASEAMYPPLLCKRGADKCVAALEDRGYIPMPPSIHEAISEPQTKRQYTRATLGRFIRGNRLPQLISEFLEKRDHFVPTSAFEGQTIKFLNTYAKVLSYKTGEPTGAPEALASPQSRLVSLGVFRTPAQFIEEARNIKHPIDLPSFLPDGLLENIFWLLTTPKEKIAKTRLDKIRQMKLWALELQQENNDILSNLPPEQRAVLNGKHLALMRKVLNEIHYKGTHLVDHIIEGTLLIGDVHRSNIFPPRYKPSSISPADLLSSSRTTRRPIIDNSRSSGDHEIDEAVWNDTMEEVDKGWLSPMMTEEQVTNMLGSDFVVARRFGIRQSGKIRSIDDYSEPQTNQTNGTKEKIDLLGTDEFFVLLKQVATMVSDDGTVSVELADGRVLSGRIPHGISPAECRNWMGKTFDLKSAYRQLATSRSDLNTRVAIICVYNPNDRRPYLFLQYSTPFGSVSSVYLFNRAARALWAIGIWLGLAWVNYFDDYPIAEPSASADIAELTVRSMFSLLGWTIALEIKKNKPFGYSFSMLGVIANLQNLPEKTAIYENKPERIDDLTLVINNALQSGRCPQPLMAEIRGKSQFAAAQITGRIASGPLHVMSMHQFNTRTGKLNPDTISAMQRLKEILTAAPARTLQFSGETRPVLVFTDGACEGIVNETVTIGAVIIDTATNSSRMWGGHVCKKLVKIWKSEGKTQVIGQAELLPTVMVRLADKESFRHRRLIFFIDNDSARQALIKGWSPSHSSNNIVQLMIQAEVQCQTWTWYSRVPTKSNPADDPSRLVFIPGPDNAFAKIVEMPSIPKFLYA